MKIFSTLLLLVASASFFSCEKESDQPPAEATKTDQITASAWVHESSGIDMDKNGTIDVASALAGIPACRLDNVLTFKKDGTATADEGATVKLEPLMVRSDDAKFGKDLGKATVSAKVLGHERGPKLRVFKFKPKRGYKKLNGHRQELTRIEITDILTGGSN